MVEKIIHIADIHIPNDLTVRPYEEMLKYMLGAVMKEIGSTPKENVRIVVVGDSYCQKIKVSNESKKAFHTMLNYLNELAKTIVVAGNHDMLENNTSRLDSITPTFEINGALPNIVYIDKELGYKSGYYVDDNIIWALYSMFDKFAKPNIDGLKEKYPDSTVVGLYHGEVPGAVTDIGRMSEGGISPDEFKGCDCVMAGHIHKFQEIKKNGIPIVYSGSVFQQDEGENITGHGFVVWSIPSLKYKLKEVRNDYRILKYEIGSYEDVKNDAERLINL